MWGTALNPTAVQSVAKAVLCVEDEDLQLQLRRMVFASAGFDTLLARTGTEALELFRSKRVDAVVMDYYMSDMDGVEVAKQMKQLRPSIPIVVLSGSASSPDGSGAWVDIWLQKSFVEIDDLVAQVKNLIDSDSAPFSGATLT
jgi:CheY-like chemotaxis protein